MGSTASLAATRRGFIAGAVAAGVTGALPSFAAGAPRRPVKFLFMTDHHVESDFMERGHEVYTMWRPGNHAALEKTYEFIGKDPYCRDVDFALFGGDQLNTGYMNHPEELAAEREIYFRTLNSLDLYRRTKGTNVSDLDFRSPESFYCRTNAPKGYVQKPIPFKKLDSRVIAIQGNHDTGVPEFYRECSFRCGDTRFITFFASYVALPAPPGKFRSTARISDEAVAFVEREMAAASADPTIRHIVLASHWTVVLDDRNFKWPIFDACEANKWNDNRRRILALAEKYGCDLFINGHEHNNGYPVGKAGTMGVINCGTVTAPSGKGSFAIVEMHPEKAVFTVYSRAVAEESGDGKAKIVEEPRRLFVREIPLTPKPAPAAALDAARLQSLVDAGWRQAMTTWHPATGLVYGCRPEQVRSSKDCVNGMFPWVEGGGYGAGMGDCALICGTALSGLVDRFAVLGDAQSRDDAAKVARGVLNLAKAHGVKGFVARGLCADDGKSICSLSSRDQYTHWVHGLWRYVSSPMADGALVAEYAKLVAEIARFMEERVTPERGWNFGLADGGKDPRGICTMWGDTLQPHEWARLPMIYLAAAVATKDAHWREMYERYADEALAKSLDVRGSKKWMACYALYQANASLELIAQCDEARRAKAIAAMNAFAEQAAAKVAAARKAPVGKPPYGMCWDGELLLAQLLSPGWVVSRETETFLDEAVRRRDLSHAGVCRQAHVLASFWRWRRAGS